MIKFILSHLILFLCALLSFIAGVKFIRLLKYAILELNKIGSDNND